jgi:rod shape determining protein RodA
MFIDRRMFAQFDWKLLIVSLLIPSLGLIVLFSAGHNPDIANLAPDWLPFALVIQSPSFVRQFIFMLIGIVALIVGFSISPAWMMRNAYLFYGLALIMLIAVLELGHVSQGSRRWLSMGGFNLQPSEVMKLAVIFAMARYLSKNPPGLIKGKKTSQRGYYSYKFKELFVPFLIFLAPMVFVIKQPDLGTALSIGAIGFLMVLFMGIRVRALVFMALFMGASLIPAWGMLEPYQQRRVKALFDPYSDPAGSGYHIIQSQIAVGSGSLLGEGFMKGTQSQLNFLPEHTTDFIFSVLAEEWGFIGSVLVLLMYALLLFLIFRVALRSKDLFMTLVAAGVGISLFFHIFVNVGMVIGILPVVGLPLPLFSYGGSSIVTTMFSLGLVMGVSMRRLFFLSAK